MKNFRFNTNCNITQEPQELQRYNRACRFIGKSTVIKCHQVLFVLEIGSFYEEFSFWTLYLQHYLGTTKSTKIILCLWVHRQVCFDKISSIVVKTERY